jgi:hypothetical protein
VEEHDEALSRLLKNLNLQQGDIFRSDTDIIAEAYRIQSEEIAYREKSEESTNTERPQATGRA